MIETFGLLRSLLMYYGVPFRAGRLRNLYSQFIRPGELCYDVGAHVGSRLRVWARLGARILAVEPQPRFMDLLCRLYGQRAGITLVEAAVGAAPGEAELLVSRRTPTVTTLSPAWIASVRRARAFAGVRWDSSLRVPVTTLDALIKIYGVPAFCKIDVEGYELEVLKGLSRPLRCLSFEYVPAAAHLALGCLERLEGLGAYRYNVAAGETGRLQWKNWASAREMAAWLQLLPVDGRSGDVYALQRA